MNTPRSLHATRHRCNYIIYAHTTRLGNVTNDRQRLQIKIPNNPRRVCTYICPRITYRTGIRHYTLRLPRAYYYDHRNKLDKNAFLLRLSARSYYCILTFTYSAALRALVDWLTVVLVGEISFGGGPLPRQSRLRGVRVLLHSCAQHTVVATLIHLYEYVCIRVSSFNICARDECG
jgi:hypothetical protein